jgi:tetratricopeptide (TPR) repeat protein
VRRFRAQVLEYQGFYGAAIEEYQIAIELTRNPRRLAYLYIQQGYNSFALQNVPDAILYFEDALRFDDENADAYDALSYMYFLVGEYPRAVENAEEAVARDPDMVRAYAHLGAAQFRQNFYAQAIPNLKYAVDRYSAVSIQNAIYFNMLGLAYFFELQDCTQARPLFTEVLDAIPDEPNALEGLDLCRGS